MFKTKSILAIGCSLALYACAADTGTPDLDLQESEQGVSGTFDTGDATVVFSSIEIEPQVWDIGYELNGMTLSMVVDQANGVIIMDGYATANGGETQIVEADRALFQAFLYELNTLGTDLSPALTMLRQITEHYAEYYESLELRRVVYMEQDRSYTSVCWAVNSYQGATHDDWDYNRWNDKSTTDYAYLSMHGSCVGGEGTNHWNGSSWQCYDPGHTTNIEYAYGACYGRCGGSCGSGSQFTWDCVDHDQCNRAGHSVVSSWCSDELAGTLDDLASAPNCL